MSKKLIFYLAFFAILLAIFYVFVFDDYDFSASKLEVINPEVPAFSFTNQDGKIISQKETDDKVYVAEYFFTTCKGICPKMNANMRRIYDMYKDQPDFMILSHTCMPEVDSIEVLKAYEQKMLGGKLMKSPDGSFKIKEDANLPFVNKNWHFLTGDKSVLYEQARKGYLIDDGKPDSTQIENQFIHTQFFALVDKYRRVRGIYDGLILKEVDQLQKDINELLKEKAAPKRFMNGFSNNPG